MLRPKSAIFTLPSASNSIFSGFKSLWETPLICKYTIPKTVPDAAKDLITRMLQKNPLDRITISEIKQHKWFNNKLSLFQIIDNQRFIYGNRNKFDRDIVKQMTESEKINPEKISEEEMLELFKIKDAKSHDLRVVYDFLQTQKIEKLFKEKKAKLKSKKIYFYLLYYISNR